MKRILSALLAGLLLISSLTACATGKNPDDTGNNTQGSQVEETEDDNFPDIEKQDYNGETFHMIGWAGHSDWIYSKEYQYGGQDANVLTNTVYEMNVLVEEYLGVEISFEAAPIVTGNEVYNTVYPSIMAGDDTYQLCTLEPYYDNISFITNNYALDFHELDAINLDQPYWNREVMDTLAIEDRAYLGVGDICKYRLAILYCNKDLMEEAGLPIPYDLVREGKWTLDQLISLTSGLYSDNGDGKRNEMDIYGLANHWDINATTLMQASNIYIAAKNEDGVFNLTLYSEKLVNFYNKLYDWCKSESVHVWNYHSPDFTVDFADNHSYFTIADLGVQYLNADIRAGILPLPKYDVAQKNYAHQNWGNNILIPNTVRNRDMVGQVVELMAYYCSTIVTDKYYDEVLQLRVSEAPDDRDMVELIYDTVVFDPGIAYGDGCPQLLNLIYTLHRGILENQSNISSYYKTNEKAAGRWLRALNEKVQHFD